MRTKVGVVQMTSTADVEANLQAVERQVGLAASDGASLVVVPECFAYLGPEAGKLEIEAIPHGGHCGFMESFVRESWADRQVARYMGLL